MSQTKSQPSDWIVNKLKVLNSKSKLRILDFASGNGRNSIYLSKDKHFITAIDKDIDKLNKYSDLPNIETICFDLETKKEWPLKKKWYDVIIVVNYLYRPRIRELTSLLKDGGHLFYETFSQGNEKYGAPKNPNFLLNNNELIEIFSKDYKVLSFFNGLTFDNKISVKQKCLLKKKTSKIKTSF